MPDDISEDCSTQAESSVDRRSRIVPAMHPSAKVNNIAFSDLIQRFARFEVVIQVLLNLAIDKQRGLLYVVSLLKVLSKKLAQCDTRFLFIDRRSRLWQFRLTRFNQSDLDQLVEVHIAQTPDEICGVIVDAPAGFLCGMQLFNRSVKPLSK